MSQIPPSENSVIERREQVVIIWDECLGDSPCTTVDGWNPKQPPGMVLKPYK